ncbi:hypothetical protein [Corynebacterium pygosceleis]|uniref:hypothetical protein n=1 Tax=Corynebacterium pygosceleis TaxID=2800406 RepID=UPI0020037E0D|nr:hypothetical protein [Corynebacterium pygosceleis]MCK7676386.1 hypothetical protein [Corynebacterium pygosceleis]
MTALDQMPEGQRLGAWVNDFSGVLGYVATLNEKSAGVVYPETGHNIRFYALDSLEVLDRPRVDLPGAGEPAGHWEYAARHIDPQRGVATCSWPFGQGREQCEKFVRETPHTIMLRRWVTEWEQVEP